MGTFFHPITPTGPSGEETGEALVDTGASFTTMPASILRRLGVQSFRRARLKLADGQIAEWDLGRVHASIDGLVDETICIFGPEQSPPAIGAHTLQAILLAVDPVVDHRPVPSEGFA
jgi:predicted aspartyl protease